MARSRTAKPQNSLLHQLTAVIMALSIIGLGIWVVVRNQPFADPNIVVVLRILVAVAAAICGATIPGFLHIESKFRGFGIRAGGALALVVLTYLLTPKVLPPQPPPLSTDVKPSSLALRMDGEDFDVRKVNTNGLQKGMGKLVSFTLSNSTGGLAIVDEVAVEVLDVFGDHNGTVEALVQPFNYEITLKTGQKGKVRVPAQFKYSAGELDRIILNVLPEDGGHDYIVRLVVRWFDDVTKEKRLIESEPKVLRFPSPYQGKPEDRIGLLEKQNALIDERFAKVKAELGKK
jgi:hypothetical protein